MSGPHNERPLRRDLRVSDVAEQPILDTTVEPVELTQSHEVALQQVQQLRTYLEAQRKHLEVSGRSLKQVFERVKTWWKKEEQLETRVARLAIEADHLADQIQHASADQVSKHLQPALKQLRQQIETIRLVSVEVDQFVAEDDVESEPGIVMEAAGAMKKWEGKFAEGKGELGKYGQDCIRSNPELAIGVIADGSSTGVDSYEVARRASRRAENILEDLPLDACDSLEAVEFFLDGALEKILEEIRQMPEAMMGATTLLATRYIEKFDAVVMIDIGDCEAVAVVGDAVIPLKPPLEHSNLTDSITKSVETLRKDGKPITNINIEDETGGIWNDKPLGPKDFYKAAVSRFKRATNRPFVRSFSLAELRLTHPNLPIQILLASDGLQNTTGQTLEQQAKDIATKGPKKFLRDYHAEHFAWMGYEDYEDPRLLNKDAGKVIPVNPFADDTTLLKMVIPEREIGSAKQTAAA